MHFIEHICAPKHLLPGWQAPNDPEPTVFVVGAMREHCGLASFRYCFDIEDFRKAIQRGFVCYPAFSKREGDYTDGVMDSFINRLPPQSCRDLPNFRQLWCLPTSVFPTLRFWPTSVPGGVGMDTDPRYGLIPACRLAFGGTMNAQIHPARLGVSSFWPVPVAAHGIWSSP